MWRKTWKRDFVIMGALSMLIGGLGVWSVRQVMETPEPDTDRARFLLECQYDWMLSTKQCLDLLEGGTPPQDHPEWSGC